MAVYVRILEDMYAENQGDIRKEIRRLTHEVESLEKKLLELDMHLLNKTIEQDSYIRLKNHLNQKHSETLERRNYLRSADENFIDNLRTGMNLLANIDHFYTHADPDQKARIVCSIFPEGVIWDGSSYRTPRQNELLRLMSGNNNVLEGDASEELTGVSRVVPRTGIEPVLQP